MFDHSDILPFDRSGWATELRQLKRSPLWFKGSGKVEETADQVAQSEVAVEQWNEYATDWAPKIQTWAKDIAADKTAEKDRAAGIVNADVAQKMAGAEKALTMTGMNPNSGKAVKALSTASDVGADISGAATVTAKQGIDSNRVAGLQQVANIGMGQKTEAIEGMGTIAENSVKDAITKAGLDQQSHMADVGLGMSIAGTAAGVGMDYFSSEPAGYMSDFEPSQRAAIRQGEKDGGYSVKGDVISWNS